MATIVTRAGKGSALTHNEVDANFNNLNNDKIEAAQTVTLTNKTLSTGTAITAGTINGATIGATTPSSGAFTTLSASSTVSGTGFSTYLASPPAIGGTAAAAGSFTTLSATGVTTVQAGTVSAPAITTSGDTNTGIFFPAADTVAIGTGGVQRITADSSGNLRLNTSTGELQLAVGAERTITPSGSSGSTALTFKRWNGSSYVSDVVMDASGNLLVGTTSGSYAITARRAPAVSDNQIMLEAYRTTGANSGVGDYLSTGNGLYGHKYIGSNWFGSLIGTSGIVFNTGTLGSETERARITSGGAVYVGKTARSFATTGWDIQPNGDSHVTADGVLLVAFNRLTNDGTLIEFAQASVIEGTISVSGTTVSYNGGHLARYSQLLSSQRDESILKGTVLSNLDEMCEWLDAEGNPLPNEQLNRMKVSDVEGDTNVAGVFVNWDNDDQDNPYDMNIAMTGDMIIRIAQGVTVQKGDLLMSAGDGTAKPQGDDIVRSKTVAKVTSNHVTCTYEDGSYCVPCVLMAC